MVACEGTGVTVVELVDQERILAPMEYREAIWQQDQWFIPLSPSLALLLLSVHHACSESVGSTGHLRVKPQRG